MGAVQMSIDSVYHILVQDFIGRDIYVPWKSTPHVKHVEEHHYPSAKKADNLVPTRPAPPIDTNRGTNLDILV